MKQLADAADQRWKEKESFLDRPQDTGQTAPALEPGSGAKGSEDVGRARGDVGAESRDTREGSREANKKSAREDPWKQHRGANSGGWQPQSWTPGNAERR